MAASELLNNFLFHFLLSPFSLHSLLPPGSTLIAYKHATSYPCACISLKDPERLANFLEIWYRRHAIIDRNFNSLTPETPTQESCEFQNGTNTYFTGPVVQ
jgi:hypothetical protein